MSALTDFYDFYAPMRAKYGLRLTMSSNAKQTKITIYEGRKELVKVVEDEYDVCYIRAKRELEEIMKKYEQQTETKEKAQRAGCYMDKIRESYAEKQQ